MTPTNASIAAAVRAELARAGVSRRQLARDLGVDKSYLDRRLTPKTPDDVLPPFPIEQLGKIATLLGIPLARLIESAPAEQAS